MCDAISVGRFDCPLDELYRSDFLDAVETLADSEGISTRYVFRKIERKTQVAETEREPYEEVIQSLL